MARGLNTVAQQVVPSLRVTGLTKSFPGTLALDGLDLDVLPGEVHALLGENGSGKSTLIKVLSGYHAPDPGSAVEVGGEPLEFGSPASSYLRGCRFVHQDLGLVQSLSVLDNMSLGSGYPTRVGTIRSKALMVEARQSLVAAGLDIDPRVLVADLPASARTIVAIARALRDDSGQAVKLLVLDEPTAALPETEVEHLLASVRSIAARGVGVLYVSHRLDEVFEIADRVTVLRDGRKVGTQGIAELNRPRLISMLIGTELADVRAASDSVRPVGGDPTLVIRDFSAAPVDRISLEVRPGQILGVAGITGSGRETILPALFGAGPRDGGTVTLDGRAVPAERPRKSISMGMGYLPPDRKTQGGIADFTARENLTLANLRPFWRWGLLSRRREVAEATHWLTALGVRPADALEDPLSTFSGGNQQKILVGKWLRCKPRVLLLDEPTQGVDVGAKADLHQRIVQSAAEGTAVVVSSSDLDELVAICHEVIVLRRGRIVARFSGREITLPAISRQSLGIGEVID